VSPHNFWRLASLGRFSRAASATLALAARFLLGHIAPFRFSDSWNLTIFSTLVAPES